MISDYLSKPLSDQSGLERVIKEYIAIKLQLEEEEISDNITIMVRISVSKATSIPLEKLKAMDRPGACGSAPTVLAKKGSALSGCTEKAGSRHGSETGRQHSDRTGSGRDPLSFASGKGSAEIIVLSK